MLCHMYAEQVLFCHYMYRRHYGYEYDEYAQCEGRDFPRINILSQVVAFSYRAHPQQIPDLQDDHADKSVRMSTPLCPERTRPI